ncbi:MAG: DNA repair protein RadC [Rubrivivax sp.]|jgi:DNA repair protein RadC|nr:DNA repair protein RadC [Rubrivivax sp.]
MTIKQLPAELRPREKLLARGSGALADTELLALLLRTGLPGEGVFALAERLLGHFGGLAGLLHAAPADLGAVKGLGPAKRAELLAVIELARRALAEQMREQPVFDAPQKVKDYLALHLAARPQEVFAAMFLDAQHRLLTMEDLFHGTLTQTSVYPREVVRRALLLNAAAVVLAHNHPSGLAEPSRADELLTATLKHALALVDVRVLDHVVVGRGQVVSMAERGLV